MSYHIGPIPIPSRTSQEPQTHAPSSHAPHGLRDSKLLPVAPCGVSGLPTFPFTGTDPSAPNWTPILSGKRLPEPKQPLPSSGQVKAVFSKMNLIPSLCPCPCHLVMLTCAPRGVSPGPWLVSEVAGAQGHSR